MFNRLGDAFLGVFLIICCRSNRTTQIQTIASIFFQTVAVASHLATAYFLSNAIKELYRGSETTDNISLDEEVISYLVYAGAALLLSSVFESSSKLLTSSIKTQYAAVINRKLLTKFSELDLDYTVTMPLGVFVRQLQLVYQNQDAVSVWLDEIYPTLITLTAASASLLAIDWQTGLIFFGISSLGSTFSLLGVKSTTAIYQDQERRALGVFGRAIGRIQDHENIRLFARVERELAAGISEVDDFSFGYGRLLRVPELNSFAIAVWGTVASAGMGVFSARQAYNKDLPLNYFVMILIYLSQLNKIFDRANRGANRLLACQAAMEVVDQFLKMPQRVPPIVPRPFMISDDTSSVTFKHVVFSYGSERVLNDVSFSIPHGTQAAIVGLSGAGKSTVARLLLRSYVPDSGIIEIAETDINNIRTEALCQVVGLVGQNPRFANGSLATILREAKPDATDAELIAVLNKASLSDFATPEALTKSTGEGGLKLSGGQKQRLAIARVLLRKPYLAVLDEATSALDMETATEVLSTIAREMVDITTIIITHNVLSIRNSDWIIVLDEGRVAQQNTFSELMKDKEGRFYNLVRKYCEFNEIDVATIKPSKTRSARTKALVPTGGAAPAAGGAGAGAGVGAEAEGSTMAPFPIFVGGSGDDALTAGAANSAAAPLLTAADRVEPIMPIFRAGSGLFGGKRMYKDIPIIVDGAALTFSFRP